MAAFKGLYDFDVIPYAGDLNKYGLGPGHKWFDFYGSQDDEGGPEEETEDATADPGTWQQQNGGPDGGQSDASQRDSVHGKSFDMMTNQELADYSKERAAGGFLSRNFESLAPSLVASLVMGALEKDQLAAELGNRGRPNPGDFVGGQVAGAAGTGMNNAGGVPNPELAGRSGGGSNDLSPSDMAQISAAAEAANNDPRSGGMANGGMYRGALPPPRFIRGPGDGRSDSIPAFANGGMKGRVRVSDGEFVWPADTVSAAGNGSSEAGARRLGQMAQMLRQKHMAQMSALPPPGR